MESFGISTGEAEQVGGEVIVPIKFRGINKPDTFITAFNTAKEMLDTKGNILDFLFALWPIIKKSLKISL